MKQLILILGLICITVFSIGQDLNIHTTDGDIYTYSIANIASITFTSTTQHTPCPGIPTITYGGQTYNTVLIGSQCWLKENLNYSTSSGSWCYDNSSSNCDTYGRLYEWETALTVCPSGWHLPSDDEWKILEGTVDTQYPVGDPEWDGGNFRGYDAGERLKSIVGWHSAGIPGTDVYGFTGLPGGQFNEYSGDFSSKELSANFWTSTEQNDNNANYRQLYYESNRIKRSNHNKENGHSVRCMKD